MVKKGKTVSNTTAEAINGNVFYVITVSLNPTEDTSLHR